MLKKKIALRKWKQPSISKIKNKNRKWKIILKEVTITSYNSCIYLKEIILNCILNYFRGDLLKITLITF